MSKRKEILGQSWIYSVGTQIAQLITLLAAILSRRFLGPAQTGIWTTLQILVEYSKYSTLGTMDAVAREIPYRIGKGENEEAEKTKNLAATFVFSGSIFMVSAIAAGAFLTRGRFSIEITYGLFFVAVVIFLQRVNNLQIALLRCYKRFDVEAVFMIVSAAVNAALVGLLAYFFKIYGFIWALILSLAFNIFYVRTRYKFNFKWVYDLKALKPLVGYGLPLMTLGLLMTLFRSLDRIMIAKFLGFEQLGWYSIALMVTSYLSNFPVAIGIVLLPHFQEKFGEKDSADDLRGYLAASVMGVTLLMLVLVAFVALAAPYGIHFFLPEFIPGVGAMKHLLLGMFFIALSQLYYDTLITIKKHLLLFPILLGCSLLTAALDGATIRLGWGIEGVAFSTAVGFFIYFLLLQLMAAKFFHLGSFFNKPLLSALGWFVYLFCFLTAMEKWVGSDFTSWTAARNKILAFVLFSLIPLWMLNSRFKIFSILKAKFYRRTFRPND